MGSQSLSLHKSVFLTVIFWCAFICTCIGCSVSYPGNTIVNLNVNSFLSVTSSLFFGLLLYGSYLLLTGSSHLLKIGISIRQSRRTYLIVLVLALFFAACLWLGIPLSQSYSTDISEIHISYPFSYGSDGPHPEWNNYAVIRNLTVIYFLRVILFIGYYAIAFSCIIVAFACCDKFLPSLSTISKQSSHTWTNKFFSLPDRKYIAVVLLIILIAWMPYIVTYIPGSYMNDTSRQLAQYFHFNGLYPTTHFPYAVAILYGSLFEVGLQFDPSGNMGTFLMFLVQLVLALFVLAQVMVWMRRLCKRRGLVYFALIFFALFPLFPVYTLLIGKDTLQAYLIVLFVLQCLLLVVKQQDNAKIQKSFIYHPVALALVALGVSLTRNDGIFIVVFALLCYTLLYKSKKILAVMISVFAITALWYGPAIDSLGVVREGSNEALSIPVQIIGNAASHDYALDDETVSTIENAFSRSYAEVGQLYMPRVSDPMKNALTVDKPGYPSTGDIVHASANIFMRYPLQSLSAVVNTTLCWYPFTVGTFFEEAGVSYPPIHEEWSQPGWHPSAHTWDQVATSHLIFYYFCLNIRFIPPINVFYSIGMYSWLILFIFAYALYKKTLTKETFITLSPLFMKELVLFASPVGSIRYALPLIMSLPIMLVLLYLQGKIKTQDSDNGIKSLN